MKSPLPYIARDVAVLCLLYWSISQHDARIFWPAIACGAACFVYDVRLMWMRAGERMKGRSE